ncbi:hypothetical protein KD5_01110 [Yersinia pseudotuberculosis]|uniref:HEPN domain-containing protein n=1 Tax=Yersinia pseudotuberculosis TaxID=633 RepID=UPI00061BE81A|nr:HEPN domain-containing protein [Yersinia pseudotuberculosis]CNK90882.1 HEPN domain [Yersinia pseudotuberculosis]
MEDRVYTNNIATRSFRDVADQDYISARLCSKHGLTLQFLWLAHQAIEKYLKAILIYNNFDTKDLNHNLLKSLDRVYSIPSITFDFSENVKEFIEYLNDQGPNRYLEREMYTHGNELLTLDKCVWEIRRYCKVINYNIQLSSGENVNLLSSELKTIHAWMKSKNKHTFSINNGYLEKILKSNNKINKSQSSILIWKNFYFGNRKKNTIQWAKSLRSVTPTQIAHPEGIEAISKLVRLAGNKRRKDKK